MDLKVLGAAFGRTGTSTLSAALKELGYGEVYHMTEVFKKPEYTALWCEGKPRWDTIFKGYSAALDWPACLFVEELARLNPSAKVILTLRDAEQWYDSCKATIWQRHLRRQETGEFMLSDEIIWRRTFDGRFSDRLHAIRVYNDHINYVRRIIDKSRLLEFRVTDGWRPLCDFLGFPVPDKPFPNLNSRQTFQGRCENAIANREADIREL